MAPGEEERHLIYVPNDLNSTALHPKRLIMTSTPTKMYEKTHLKEQILKPILKYFFYRKSSWF